MLLSELTVDLVIHFILTFFVIHIIIDFVLITAVALFITGLVGTSLAIGLG